MLTYRRHTVQTMSGRTLIACLLCGCLWPAESFTVPTPRITALSPQGIRFQIDSIPGVTLIAYHYSVNVPVLGTASGTYNKDVTRATADGFVEENGEVALKDGDTVYYWVHAIFNDGQNTLGYNLLNKQWTYRASTVEPPPLTTLPTPQLPITRPTPPRRTTFSTPTPNASTCVAFEVTSTLPTAANKAVSTASPETSDGGLSVDPYLALVVATPVAAVLAVALTIVLAILCVRRAKRLAKAPSPDLPLRTNNARPNPPTGFAQPWSANVGSEDPGYEDPDKLYVKGAHRGVAPGMSWSQPVHLNGKGTRPKAPTPSHEYITLTTSIHEVDGGYISAIAE